MAGNFYNNNNDSIDISELASLNEDISDDLLDKLQGQLSTDANSFNAEPTPVNENDDSTLFEEPAAIPPKETKSQEEVKKTEIKQEPQKEKEKEKEKEENKNNSKDSNTKSSTETKKDETEKKDDVKLNQNFDDNFIKKYKAKLNKKAQEALKGGASVSGAATKKYMQDQDTNEPIENLTNGNITEHSISKELKNYNESLDFLDGNVKYSKYVIYIDPQNVDFIESLTVKERKNLINSILRQQDDIAITKQRFAIIQTVIRHVIVAVLTLAIAIPVIYYVINASLEATIENHRRSETNWQTLYKEHGKITKN